MDARCLDPRGLYATRMILTLGSKGDRSSPETLYHCRRGVKAFCFSVDVRIYTHWSRDEENQLTNDYIVLYRLRKRMEKQDLRSKCSFESLMSNLSEINHCEGFVLLFFFFFPPLHLCFDRSRPWIRIGFRTKVFIQNVIAVLGDGQRPLCVLFQVDHFSNPHKQLSSPH